MAKEIPAIQPATPPTIPPMFELCPPGVGEFEELLVGCDKELEGDPVEAVGTVPGPSSGASKGVRYKCEASEKEKETRERVPTTDGI